MVARPGRGLPARPLPPVVSDVVAAEIQEAPEPVHRQYGEILSLPSVEVLVVTDEVIELAEAYQQRKISPRGTMTTGPT